MYPDCRHRRGAGRRGRTAGTSAPICHLILSGHPAKPVKPDALPNRKLPREMTVNNKRVFYVKYLANEIYVDILKARADVRLDRLENDSPDAVAAPILAAAHAYQVGAARDEIARHFHVDQDLLKRAP